MIKSEFPKAFAVIVWCRRILGRDPDQNGESEFMTDPFPVTLSDVPAAFLNGSSNARLQRGAPPASQLSSGWPAYKLLIRSIRISIQCAFEIE